MVRYFKTFLFRLKHLTMKLVYMFYPKRYDKVIWLIGSGRSGTTWISSLINHRGEYREIFEPFHPSNIECRLIGFKKHQYLRPDQQKFDLHLLAKLVFSGSYYNIYDRTGNNQIWNSKHRFLLVKDIFANLMAYNVCLKKKTLSPF